MVQIWGRETTHECHVSFYSIQKPRGIFMESILKKMGPAAALSLVAFTGVLNAAEDAQMRNLENRISALEQKKGASGMVNPPARPVVKDGVDIFFAGEVLVWRATQDDMAYAVELDQAQAVNGFNSGETQHWRGKWAAGFRLALGYNMKHDGWDLDLVWARFNSKGKLNETNECSNTVSNFNPVFLPKEYSNSTTTGVAAIEAEAKRWKLNLNLLDLELGREFFVSKWLTLRPHMGVRGAWVRQKMGVEYAGGNVATPYQTLLAGANSLDFESMKNNFWGVGLRGGLDSNWGLGCGFSIYGKLALSAVWGKFKVSEVANVQNENTGTSAAVMNIQDRFSVMRPIADMALGLRYDTTFAD
ncbi:MAG: Lpg1974 family pore-forming outer membrane protein, partial [Chlamydiales bacterium]